MNPDHFSAVRELFERIVDLPRVDRDAALRENAADASLVVEVLALCDVSDAGATHFAAPLAAMLESAAANILTPGDTLGVWRVVREIGTGGMGSVYLVERTDGHYRQTAALKFVKGAPRAETLAYFTRERQLLALLSHPNVARLLDGGAGPRGQPYLVMEFVDGVPIDRYCSERRLGVPAILALFATACAAVAFAHRQLVVHCDLKPSNLFVTQDGRPVLLDFGIARLLDQVEQAPRGATAGGGVETGELVAAAQGKTVAAAAPFTPRYASPEQRERGAVTTASDIYSLGVMLRELLDAASGGNTPSAGAAAARTATLRERELAAILDKATHPDAAQRYASVDALTDDIHHYLRHEPVRALSPAPLYAARKLLVRRWPAALAAAIFAITIAGFTVKVVVESRRALAAERQALADRDRAREAEQVAVKERNRTAQAELSARQTSQFLVSIFDSGNPNAESGDIPVSKLIAAAEARLDTQLAGQPATQAELYGALAQVQFNMGRIQESAANFRRAIELERRQHRPLVLAQMLARQAYADLYAFGGKEAVALAREALALREPHAAAEPEAVAESLAILGAALFATKGELRESGELLRRSLAIRDKLDPAGAGAAQSLWYLASHAEKSGRFDEAIELNRRALAIREQRFGAEHPACLEVRDTLAWALHRARRSQEAEAITRGTLAVRERLHGRGSQPVLRNMVILGSVLGAAGRLREQLKINRDALAIADRLLGRESKLYANLLNNIAMGQMALGRIDAALRGMEAVLPLARKIWSPMSPATAAMETNLGVALRKAGRLDASAAQLRKAIEVNLAVHGKTHPEVAEAYVELAMTSALAGKAREAAGRLEQAHAAADMQKLPRAQATSLQAAAILAAQQGKRAEALAGFRRAEQVLTAAYGDQDPRTALAMLYRAELLARGSAAERGEAAALAARMLTIAEDKLAPDAPVLGRLRRLREETGLAN